MVRKVAAEVAVAVINHRWSLLLAAGLISAGAQGAILPEERADLMYHSYDGGGIEIIGPAVLVRKTLRKDLSVSAQYYVDQISGASIDVMATASPYDEERTEYSFTADYLVNKTLLSSGYTNSSENDYEADTFFFSISQDFFGALSTLDLSFSFGDNEIYSSVDSGFAATSESRSFQVSWTQVLTRSMVANLTYHVITDEGFLNNPYRLVRYIDPAQPVGFNFQPEVYPNTRSSQAFAARVRYFLPYRAALALGYRLFVDTWDIEAHTWEMGYTHPLGEHWIMDTSLRFYQQTDASFYADLFPFEDAQTYLARDKELSDFQSTSLGLGISYEFEPQRISWVDKVSFNLAWTYIYFDYTNFRNITAPGSFTAGSEPFYDFDANVLRLIFSVWF